MSDWLWDAIRGGKGPPETVALAAGGGGDVLHAGQGSLEEDQVGRC